MDNRFEIKFTVGEKEYNAGVLLNQNDLPKNVDMVEMLCEQALRTYCRQQYSSTPKGDKLVRIVEDGEEYWDYVN